MAKSSYNYSVFINCPIDKQYRSLFNATVFAILRCDFFARCALEEDDSSDIRLHKIFRIISECRLGIHDLSRTQLDRKSGLPRFNMPLELGMYLSAKYFGGGVHDRKVCLVFEAKRHTYQKFISDIQGQDIQSHNNDVRTAIVAIRNWLAANSPRANLKGGDALWKDYKAFQKWLPGGCRDAKLKASELTFGDFTNLSYEWMENVRA